MTKTLNTNLIFVLTLISALLVLVSYIFQIGSLNRDIYSLANYERKLSSLLDNNKVLDISFSMVNSLSNIDDYLVKSNFIRPDYVKYIQILEGSVATK